MATLYDFPLDLLQIKDVLNILNQSSTMEHIIKGYVNNISRYDPTDQGALKLIEMMDFFASTGICSRNSLATKAFYKNGSIAPGFRSKSQFSSYPLDTFIGQLKTALKQDASQVAVAAKATSPQINVNVPSKGVSIDKDKGIVTVSESAEVVPTSFYFTYQKSTVMSEKDYLLSERLLVVHKRASMRGLDCNLSLADLKKLFSRKTCYYTGERFDEATPDLNPTIDRINPNLGYVSGNVVLCSRWANAFKAEVLEGSNPRLTTSLKILEKFTQTLTKSSFERKIFVKKSSK